MQPCKLGRAALVGAHLFTLCHLAPLLTLLQVKEQNLAEAIGVSNFNAKRLKAAAKRLQQAGINLASNQVSVREWRLLRIC